MTKSRLSPVFSALGYRYCFLGTFRRTVYGGKFRWSRAIPFQPQLLLNISFQNLRRITKRKGEQKTNTMKKNRKRKYTKVGGQVKFCQLPLQLPIPARREFFGKSQLVLLHYAYIVQPLEQYKSVRKHLFFVSATGLLSFLLHS